MLSVAVVSGGGFQGGAVLKGLAGRHGIRAVLLDVHAENVGKYRADAFHRVPPLADEAAFLADLDRIIRAEAIRVLLPATAYELPLLARLKADLRRDGVLAAVPDPALLDRLLDKRRAHRLMAEAGLAVLAEPDLRGPGLPFPLLGKPLSGWGGRGLRLLRSPADLGGDSPETLRRGWFWQPYLEDFQEWSVDFAVGFAGEKSPLVARRRLRTSGGFAVVCENGGGRDVLEQAALLQDRLAREGGCGIFNLQVLEAKDGRLSASDLNPRAGVSSVFTLGLGHSLPYFVCRTADPALPEERPAAGRVRMVRDLEETFLPLLGDAGVRGVVFDLDDTVMDQKRWMLDKLRLLHRAFAGRLPDEATFLLAAMQVVEEGPRDRLLDALISRLGLPASLRGELIDAYRAALPEEAVAFPDAEPCLRRLKAAGLKLALLTDNPVPSQEQKLSRLACAPLFDAVVMSAATGREKPDPEPFLRAAGALGLPPGGLLMVGDNLYRDAAGALRAGYAGAALLERPGTFFNPHLGIWESLGLAGRERVFPIRGLAVLPAALGLPD